MSVFSLSFLAILTISQVDDTNLLAQSAVNDEQGPNDPYNVFFAVSLVLSNNRTSTDYYSG